MKVYMPMVRGGRTPEFTPLTLTLDGSTFKSTAYRTEAEANAEIKKYLAEWDEAVLKGYEPKRPAFEFRVDTICVEGAA